MKKTVAPTSPWSQLVISQQGGVAGLLRGAKIEAKSLTKAERERISGLLPKARAQSITTAPYADQQVISLECHQDSQVWCATFDCAHLPETMSQLMQGVELKPMRPR
jgi:hypothetical protein